MGVRVNVRMFKIVRTLTKVGVRTYTTYAHCRALGNTLEQQKISSALLKTNNKRTQYK